MDNIEERTNTGESLLNQAKELQPLVKQRLNSIISAKHYNIAEGWVEELDRNGYDVGLYKKILEGKRKGSRR